MEKSAAFLLGFQQGVGGDLDFEKAAELYVLLEEALARNPDLCKSGAWPSVLSKLFQRISAKFGRGVKPVTRTKQQSTVPASLRVAGRGERGGEFDVKEIPGRTAQPKGEPGARGPRFGPAEKPRYD